MNRLPVFWVGRPDDDDPDDSERSIHFSLHREWVAVDSDQLILPVKLHGRDGETFDEPTPGLLKQYGGEGLLNDLLMSEADPDRGSEWVISYDEAAGFHLYPVPSDDSDD